MTDFQLLSPEQHKDVKVITDHRADLGDNLKFVQTFPFEFRNVQNSYPIFLHKDPDSNDMQCIALLGFEQNENLFLTETGWDASYVPLMIKRQPFLIGFQSQTNENKVL